MPAWVTKIGGGLLVLAVFGLVVWFYGKAQYRAGKSDGASVERSLWQDKVVEAEREKLSAYRAGVISVVAADGRYIETVRTKVVPVVERIIERSTAYAATPDGASVCLTPDRVRGLEEALRPLLEPAPSTAAGVPAGPVPSDPVAPRL